MTDKHEHLDEGTIHAWLDGELPPDESTRVERQAGACAECAALVAEARGLVAASSRILSSLDTVPGGVIPGMDTGTDQLAALRARRRETSRRWWNERRILAAASLVFVAGASSLVWRYAGTSAVTGRAAQEADAVESSTDSAVPPVTAPAAPPPAPSSVGNAQAPRARAENAAPLRDAAPLQVAGKRAVDSTADRKDTGSTQSLVRRDAIAANEVGRADAVLSQRAVDSLNVALRAPRSAFEPPLQQGAASQSQQSLRQRAESRAAAPPSVAGGGARLGSVVTTGVAASAPAADMAQVLGCYRLQRPETQRDGPTIIADSVQLLNEFSRERTDPAWFRARAAGWSDTSLVWRSDSTTVELRSRLVSRPLAVRFSIAGLPLPLVPEAGVRAAVAVRIRCPT